MQKILLLRNVLEKKINPSTNGVIGHFISKSNKTTDETDKYGSFIEIKLINFRLIFLFFNTEIEISYLKQEEPYWSV